MSMKRLALVAALGCAALMTVPTEALAHGGQFKAPGGAVPPGMREPTDPTPPPAPPPTSPPTTPSPTDPPKTPAGPITPPPSAPPPTTGPGEMGGQGRGKRSALSFDQWIFWYAYNNSEIENLKEAIYSKVSSDNPLAVMGGSVGNQDNATHDIRSRVDTQIIPAMMWAMDPKNAGDTDIESAAYIGLAKMTKDPQHIEILQKGLDKGNDKIIKESAALSLGLLRRTSKKDQFSAVDLDKLRVFLFDVIEDDDYQYRERCFAAFGLGLLGDQPSGSGSYEGHTATTARLFSLAQRDYSSPEIAVALITAIGMQPEGSVTGEQRDLLRDVVLKGKLGKKDAKGLIPSEAAAALGRIGNSQDVAVLRRALTSKRTDRYAQSSAAIGLGRLSALISSDDRVDLGKSMIKSLKKVKNLQAINFSLISLAYIAVEDIKAEKTAVLSQTPIGDYLLKTATDGRPLEKPYAALALGLICREIGDKVMVDVYGSFRHKALQVLREGLASTKMSKRDQSAFAISLGIARDHGSTKELTKVVADKKSDKEKAGYSAVALGLIGARGNPEVREAIRETLTRTRDEELKIRCAIALGLLKDQGALTMLLTQLKEASTQALKGQIALAIAKIGDGRAVEPMINIIKDQKEKDLTRAIVTAALGVIGDLEWIRSLNRITKDINYRAMNDSRREIVSIL